MAFEADLGRVDRKPMYLGVLELEVKNRRRFNARVAILPAKASTPALLDLKRRNRAKMEFLFLCGRFGGWFFMQRARWRIWWALRRTVRVCVKSFSEFYGDPPLPSDRILPADELPFRTIVF